MPETEMFEGLLTLEEFERLPNDGYSHELTCGRLVREPPSDADVLPGFRVAVSELFDMQAGPQDREVNNTARRHPSAVLLAVQLLGVLADPFLRDSASGRILLSLFSMTVLLLAVWAVLNTPALTWVAVLIGVPTVACTILEGLFGRDRSSRPRTRTAHAPGSSCCSCRSPR